MLSLYTRASPGSLKAATITPQRNSYISHPLALEETPTQLLTLHRLQQKDHRQLKLKGCFTQCCSTTETLLMSVFKVNWRIQHGKFSDFQSPLQSCISTRLNYGSWGASIPSPFRDLFQCNHLSFPLHPWKNYK